jgi:ferritin-like protein
MSSESYHEPVELLSEGTRNLHRALVSLREELEAVDWYQQRAEACSDAELRAILTHNKNEEIEHAMMTLEWLRRNSPVFGDHIQTYVNTTGSIVAVETAATGAPTGNASASAPAAEASTSLGIGSLKGNR